jgi:hypothetical protein
MPLILLTFPIGYLLLRRLFGVREPILLLAGSFLVGTLVSGTVLYLLDLVFLGALGLAWPAVALVLLGGAAAAVWAGLRRKAFADVPAEWRAFRKDEWAVGVGGVSLAYALVLNVFTFYRTGSGDIAVRGFAWSDILYHNAYVASIAAGGNVPTTYPYFADTPIHYHFLFDYFAGKSAYLWTSTVDALNVMSALGLAALLLLLFQFGRTYFRSVAVGVLTPVLLVFQGSAAAFAWVASHKPFTSGFWPTAWLKGAAYESWGLFNVNVFINQRHFAFALALCVLVVLLVLAARERAAKAGAGAGNATAAASSPSASRRVKRLRAPWERRGLRLPKPPPLPRLRFADLLARSPWTKETAVQDAALMAAIALLPFWNAIAAVCCIALVGLLGLREFRRDRALLIRLVAVAALAGLLVLPQLRMLQSGGSVLAGYPKLHWFYAVGGLSLEGFFVYYWNTLGVRFLLILAATYLVARGKGVEMAIFAVPFLIANVVQLGKVLYDNNKLMIVSLLFLNAFAAHVVVRLAGWADGKAPGVRRWLRVPLRVAAGALVLAMTLAGILEIGVVEKMPSIVLADRSSPVVRWVRESTAPDDVFLTYPKLLSRDNAATAVTLAGRMLYCVKDGVDASVDPTGRMETAKAVYRLIGGAEEAAARCRAEGVDYVVVDDSVRMAKDLYGFDEVDLERAFEVVHYCPPGVYGGAVYVLRVPR